MRGVRVVAMLAGTSACFSAGGGGSRDGDGGSTGTTSGSTTTTTSASGSTSAGTATDSATTDAGGCASGDMATPAGLCTRVIGASVGPTASATIEAFDPACPPTVAAPPADAMALTWEVRAWGEFTGFRQRDAFLSFDTSDLPASPVVRATLVVDSVQFVAMVDAVGIYGGSQPVFGDLDVTDFGRAGQELGVVAMGEIDTQGQLRAEIEVGQINRGGASQFRLGLIATCMFLQGTNAWQMVAPAAADDSTAPRLLIEYDPA